MILNSQFKPLVLLFLISLSQAGNAQLQIYTLPTDTLLALEQYDKVLKIQKRVVENEPNNAREQYLLAKYYALNKENKLALYHLEKAFSLGYDVVTIAWDNDLKGLHGSKKFKTIIAELKENYKKQHLASDYKLTFSILNMYKQDQWIRGKSRNCYGICSPEKVSKIKEQWHIIDSINGDFIRVYLEKNEFPSKELVGTEAARAFASLFIHASLDLQEKYFLAFRDFAMKGGVPKSKIAYLTDKILSERIGMTLYGTQVQKNDNGEYEPVPILHEEGVEERRQKLEMRMSLKNYFSVYGIEYPIED